MTSTQLEVSVCMAQMTCPTCHGTGDWAPGFIGESPYMTYMTCPDCGGTGKLGTSMSREERLAYLFDKWGVTLQKLAQGPREQPQGPQEQP